MPTSSFQSKNDRTNPYKMDTPWLSISVEKNKVATDGISNSIVNIAAPKLTPFKA